jgi:hypothetical protein
MASQAGGSLHIPAVQRFDSNIITPGAPLCIAVAALTASAAR